MWNECNRDVCAEVEKRASSVPIFLRPGSKSNASNIRERKYLANGAVADNNQFIARFLVLPGGLHSRIRGNKGLLVTYPGCEELADVSKTVGGIDEGRE